MKKHIEIKIGKDTDFLEVSQIIKDIPTGTDIVFIPEDKENCITFINFPTLEIVKEIKKYKKEKTWKKRCY